MSTIFQHRTLARLFVRPTPTGGEHTWAPDERKDRKHLARRVLVFDVFSTFSGVALHLPNEEAKHVSMTAFEG